jgi:hypothetical protein
MVFFLSAQKRVDKPGEELGLDHRQQNHDPGRWLKKKTPRFGAPFGADTENGNLTNKDMGISWDSWLGSYKYVAVIF